MSIPQPSGHELLGQLGSSFAEPEIARINILKHKPP